MSVCVSEWETEKEGESGRDVLGGKFKRQYAAVIQSIQISSNSFAE